MASSSDHRSRGASAGYQTPIVGLATEVSTKKWPPSARNIYLTPADSWLLSTNLPNGAEAAPRSEFRLGDVVVVAACCGHEGVKTASGSAMADAVRQGRFGRAIRLCERQSRLPYHGTVLMREGNVMPPTGTKCAPVFDHLAAPPTRRKGRT